MKFGTLMLGFAVLFAPVASLEKTQEEALKFLIDNGHVAADSTVDSFQIDRQGNVRLQVDQGGKIVSYGLDASTDAYQVVFMSKNKGQKKRKTDNEMNVQLETAIGEKFSVLKGGKIGAVTRSAKNRDQFEAEYTLNDKTYIVTGRHNYKRGDVSIDKIQDPQVKAEL